MAEITFSQWLSGLDFEYWSTGQHKIEPPSFFEKWAKGEAVLLAARLGALPWLLALIDSAPYLTHLPAPVLGGARPAPGNTPIDGWLLECSGGCSAASGTDTVTTDVCPPGANLLSFLWHWRPAVRCPR